MTNLWEKLPPGVSIIDDLLLQGSETIDSNFKCGICLDILLDPLQGPCGHTYCRKCVEKVHACPECRETLRRSSSSRNRFLENLISKFKVRCPSTKAPSTLNLVLHIDSETTILHGMAAKEPENLEETVNAGDKLLVQIGDANQEHDCSGTKRTRVEEADKINLCKWQGTIGDLYAHITVCDYSIVCCPFKLHGCLVSMPRKELAKHQISCMREHLDLLGTSLQQNLSKVTSLGGKVVDLQSKILNLHQEQTNDAKNILSGGSCFILWRISDVHLHVAGNHEINSKTFKVPVPGRGTYFLQLQIKFGPLPDNEKPLAHKDTMKEMKRGNMSLHINHMVDEDGACKIYPIEFGGSSFFITVPQLNGDEDEDEDEPPIEERTKKTATCDFIIAGPQPSITGKTLVGDGSRGFGWPSFISDVLTLRANSIHVNGNIKIKCNANSAEVLEL